MRLFRIKCLDLNEILSHPKLKKVGAHAATACNFECSVTIVYYLQHFGPWLHFSYLVNI